MSCDRVKDLIPEYAIGALGEEEKAEVESHLEQCSEARSLLHEYEEITEALLYAVPFVIPPESVRESIMNRVGAERKEHRGIRAGSESRFAWMVAAVAILMLVVSNLYWTRALHRTEKKLSYQATVVSLIAGNHVVELQGQAKGMIHYDPNGKIGLLEVFGMPIPPEGKSYQLWLIRPDQKRDSGAVFTVESNGNGVVIFRAPKPLSEYVGVGVTLEPKGGSPAPTGPKVLKGKLPS